MRTRSLLLLLSAACEAPDKPGAPECLDPCADVACQSYAEADANRVIDGGGDLAGIVSPVVRDGEASSLLLTGGVRVDTDEVTWYGWVYPISLPASPGVTTVAHTDPFVLEPDQTKANSSISAVEEVADLTGDGEEDLLVHEYTTSDAEGFLYEAIHLYDRGVSAGYLGSPADSMWQWVVVSDSDFSFAGTNWVVTDHDGDGYHDLLVGVGGNNPYGVVHFLPGPLAPSETRLRTFDGETLVGNEKQWLNSEPLESIADLDGDGLDEIAVRAWTGSHLIGGGTPWPTSFVDVTDGIAGRGMASIASAGDFNHDGYGDVITTPGCFDCESADYDVPALIYYGPVVGWKTFEDRDVGTRQADWDRSLSPVLTGAGDVTGDGVDDVVVGDAYSIEYGEEGRIYYHGAIYLVPGGGCGELDLGTDASVIAAEFSMSQFGAVVYPLGDIDGGGQADLLVDAYMRHDESGLAYIFLGEELPLTAP